MKILHIASFAGNIGDNANHLGLRRQLEHFLGTKPHYTEREIRYCYQIYQGPHRWAFDDDFVAEANAHDLTIIGGGNFFEPWLDQSATATTIDLTLERLAAIRKPLLFYGVGFDTHKGYTQDNLDKFRRFVEQALSQHNVLLTFRNDGSQDNFAAAYPELGRNKVRVVPDGGFFYTPDASAAMPLPKGRYWGLNIASDMEDLRFPQNMPGAIDWDEYLNRLAAFLRTSLDAQEDLNIILFPHIFKDITAISQLLERVGDHYCRGRILVAPLIQGWSGCHTVFSLYRHCELVAGMRFHTNVCAMAMGIPAIGLVSYPKLFDLYREIGLAQRAVWVNRAGFEQSLHELIRHIQSDPGTFVAENQKLLDILQKQQHALLADVKELLAFAAR